MEVDSHDKGGASGFGFGGLDADEFEIPSVFPDSVSKISSKEKPYKGELIVLRNYHPSSESAFDGATCVDFTQDKADFVQKVKDIENEYAKKVAKTVKKHLANENEPVQTCLVPTKKNIDLKR